MSPQTPARWQPAGVSIAGPGWQTRWRQHTRAARLVRKPQYLLYGLLCGYGFAWVGHFGFEKNKPASFKRPLYSFRGDWVMWRDMLRGKIPF